MIKNKTTVYRLWNCITCNKEISIIWQKKYCNACRRLRDKELAKIISDKKAKSKGIVL